MATVGPLYSEGRTPATETAFVSTQYRTFFFLSMGSFGVRREADRERRTERGHWFRGNMPLHAAPQQPLHPRHSRSTAHRQAVNSQPFPPPDGRSTRYEPPGLRCACLPCSTYCSSTPARTKRLAPFSSARLAPSPDGPLTHFASPRGEKCRLEAVLPARGRRAAHAAPQRAGKQRPDGARTLAQNMSFLFRV